MLVSLSTACLYIYPLRKIFEIARRAGFDGVELVIGPEVEWRGGAYVRRLSQEYALPILSVHPPLFAFPGWNPVGRSFAPFLDKALRITRGVGAPMLVLHVPRARSSGAKSGGSFVNALLHARSELNGAAPRIALESGSKLSARDGQPLMPALPQLRAFADQYDFPMTLDTSHVGTWGVDLVDAIRYCEGRLANVHFSDLRNVPPWIMKRAALHSYFRQHQLPGTGFLPLKEFLRALHARGYGGPITYELSPIPLKLWSPVRVEATLRSCVEFAREAIQ